MIAIDFTQLEYFKVVATYNSISQAAVKLHITQPALSRSIAKLEKEIGTPLFDRQNHRLILNNYGRLFLASVDLAFYHLEAGIKSIRRQYICDQNILTIASSTEDFLTDLLKGFAILNPDIAFRQFHYTYPEIETHLIEHDIDLAVCSTAIESSYIHYEVMAQEEYVLVHNRSMELPGTNPISLLQLKNINFICDNSHMSNEYLKNIFSGIRLDANITYEVENVELLYELLCSNTGVVIVPLPYYWKICTRYGDRELFMRHIVEKLPKSEIGVAWLKDQPLSKTSAKFIEHLRDFLKEERKSGKRFNF